MVFNGETITLKKILAFLFVLFVSISLSGQNLLVDNAGLFTAGERADLAALLSSVAETYRFDLVILTEKDIGAARPMDYADDYFDYSGYGQGEYSDGCLFLVVTGTRDYWFSTTGRGIELLNPAAFSRLERETLKFLKKDNYSGASLAFIKQWQQFLDLEVKGRKYTILDEWGLFLFTAAWILSFIIAFVTVNRWKSGMNTALSKTEANTYMVPGSLSFTVRQDRFLYCTVSKTRRDTDSSSGGGGNTHTGSSGTSHGGGGGKY